MTAQLARQHGGLAQAGYLELEKQMIGSGKHMAAWLLAPARSAIPQLGDLASSGRHGAMAKSIRDEMSP